MTRIVERDRKYFAKSTPPAIGNEEVIEGVEPVEEEEKQEAKSFKIDGEKYRKTEARIRKVGHVAEQDT